MQEAFQRLTGKEQQALQRDVIVIFQKNYIGQGKFEDILGTYQNSSTQKISADNSGILFISPYQKISDQKVFSIAKEIANKMNQEAVAVFIPSKDSNIEDLTLKFVSYQPTINEAVALLKNKLPKLYNQAFSLHLKNKCQTFNTARVTEIEWLGTTKTKFTDIKKAFPNEQISYRSGKAYLVFYDGHKERL